MCLLVVLSELSLNVAQIPIDLIDEIEAPESSRFVAPPGPRKTRVTTAIRVRVVAEYERGHTSRQVAKSTVLRILTLEGVEVRPRGVHYPGACLDPHLALPGRHQPLPGRAAPGQPTRTNG